MRRSSRLSAAFDHRSTPFIPVDFGGHRSSGIGVHAYRNLRTHLGLPVNDVYIYDVVQQLAVIEEDLLDLFGSDVIGLGHSYIHKKGYWKLWKQTDQCSYWIPSFIDITEEELGTVAYNPKGIPIAIMKEGCDFFEQTRFPFEEGYPPRPGDLEERLEEILWFSMGTPPAPASLSKEPHLWEEAARSLRESTDRAIYGIFGGGLVEPGQFAFRMDHFLLKMALEPSTIHRFLDSLLEIHLRDLEHFLTSVAPHIDIIGFSDDMGMQLAPQFSVDMYREFFKPRHRMMYDLVRQHAPHLKICLHCCGDVYPLLPELIDIGLDAINPVQFTCKDMGLSRLKAEFGKDMVFWGGGCDTQSILPYGTPCQVSEHVRQNLEIMVEGGGFVFQQVHNILNSVPPENIVAMFEAVRDFR